ncbi:MAG: glycosyltransferase family 2 protein [Phycisphaerales bacterium]
MPTLHVVMPHFNEPETLEQSLRRLIAAERPDGWGLQIHLVDDGSAADAVAEARRVTELLAAEGVPIELTQHPENRGKGAALQTGFDAVLGMAETGDLVVIQDADLEYDPADIAGLMQPLIAGEADAVLGTRWGSHRQLRGPIARIHAAGNGLLTALSNAMTGFRVSDMECCYKLFGVDTLRRLRPGLTEPRFGIEPQIVAGLARQGARVAEGPVAYDPRGFADGKKIGVSDGLRAIWVITRERWRGRRAAPGT